MSAGAAMSPSNRRESSRLEVSEVAAAVSRVRRSTDIGADRIADVLARAFERWRDRGYARRRIAIDEIARSAGYSLELMENSIDALIKPFARDAVMKMAARMSMNRKRDRPATVGFIAAGNVAGAGIHEVAIALIAGAGIVIKTASAEPLFFAEFARTIEEIDRDAGARIEVLHWGRERADLTEALIEYCDLVVAYGDDATMESLRRPNVIGFGSRVSAALIAPDAIGASGAERVANLLARDVALFEQLGCLSPHQIFVLSSDDGAARDFAVRMAAALESIAKSMPRAKLPILDAAEIRGLRERARWRAIARGPVELFEGRGLEWTMVFERRADPLEPFKISPGFRTMHVTAVDDLAEFRACIASMSGRIEAMAVAGVESDDLRFTITEMRIPYVCAPGEMQSPPLDWAHRGGAFLEAILGSR